MATDNDKKRDQNRQRLISFRQRHRQTTVSLPLCEAQQVEAAAQKLGMTYTEYVKWCVKSTVSAEYVLPRNTETETLMTALGRIGGNLNQIAKQMYVRGKNTDKLMSHWREEFIHLKEAVEQYSAAPIDTKAVIRAAMEDEYMRYWIETELLLYDHDSSDNNDKVTDKSYVEQP